MRYVVGFLALSILSANASENGKIKCILEGEGNDKYTLVSYETRENTNVASFLLMCSSDEEHTSCATLPAYFIKNEHIEMVTSGNSESNYHILMGSRFNTETIKHRVINTVRIPKGTGVESILKIVYDKTEQRFAGYCSGSMIDKETMK